MKAKKEEFKAGKGMMKISGKEVFLFKPELAEADDEVYNREVDEDEEDEPCTEIDLDVFANELEESSTGQVEDTSKSSKITKFSTLLPKDRETAMMSGTMNYAACDTA